MSNGWRTVVLTTGMMLFWGVALASAALTGCPDAKTSAEFTVKVNVDACAEQKTDPAASSDIAVLSCPVEAGGTVKVLFPRRDLWALRTKVSEAGVGK